MSGLICGSPVIPTIRSIGFFKSSNTFLKTTRFLREMPCICGMWISYFFFKYSGLLDFILTFFILLKVFCFLKFYSVLPNYLFVFTTSEFACLNLDCITGFYLDYIGFESIRSIKIPDYYIYLLPLYFFNKLGLDEFKCFFKFCGFYLIVYVLFI